MRAPAGAITLDQVLAQLEDPETPVVWLDPALPEWLWERLPAVARGPHVLDLGKAGPIFDLSSLLAAFGHLLPGITAYDHSFPSLREALLGPALDSPRGYLVLYRDADGRRQNEEGAY